MIIWNPRMVQSLSSLPKYTFTHPCLTLFLFFLSFLCGGGGERILFVCLIGFLWILLNCTLLSWCVSISATCWKMLKSLTVMSTSLFKVLHITSQLASVRMSRERLYCTVVPSLSFWKAAHSYCQWSSRKKMWITRIVRIRWGKKQVVKT